MRKLYFLTILLLAGIIFFSAYIPHINASTKNSTYHCITNGGGPGGGANGFCKYGYNANPQGNKCITPDSLNEYSMSYCASDSVCDNYHTDGTGAPCIKYSALYCNCGSNTGKSGGSFSCGDACGTMDQFSRSCSGTCIGIVKGGWPCTSNQSSPYPFACTPACSTLNNGYCTTQSCGKDPTGNGQCNPGYHCCISTLIVPTDTPTPTPTKPPSGGTSNPTPTPTPTSTTTYCAGGYNGGGGSDAYDSTNGSHITKVTTSNCNGITCDVTFTWENKGSGTYKLIWSPVRTGSASYEYQDVNNNTTVTISGFKQNTAYTAKVSLFVSPVRYGIPYCGFKPTSPATVVSPSPTIPVTNTPTAAAGKTTAQVMISNDGVPQTPKHPQRKITLYFYTKNNYGQDTHGDHADYKATDIVTYQQPISNTSSDVATFTNPEFDLKNVPTGDYYILLKSNTTNRTLLSPQKVHITAGTNNNLTQLNSSSDLGDINGDNVIDTIDYSALIDCYGKKNTQASCTGHNLKDTFQGLYTDLNDDGVVDGIDYNILLRNLGSGI